MNKQDVINEISARTSDAYAKTTIDTVLTALGDIAQAQLTKPGAELTLPGIGKLKAVHKESRPGRNPKTGEAMEIPARTSVKFVAGKALKDAVA